MYRVHNIAPKKVIINLIMEQVHSYLLHVCIYAHFHWHTHAINNLRHVANFHVWINYYYIYKTQPKTYISKIYENYYIK